MSNLMSAAECLARLPDFFLPAESRLTVAVEEHLANLSAESRLLEGAGSREVRADADHGVLG